MTSMDSKRNSEKSVLATMILIHCKAKHGSRGGLCPDCAELMRYACQRVDACPRIAEKTFCSSCPRPCYLPEMRDRIRQVMRYAGPRMLFYHPMTMLRHLFQIKKKLQQ